jgi:(p)ppGpp synthase/HD superfamily hydrolase
MSPKQRKRLVRALDFALKAHGPQTRKGKDVPYGSHLLQVAGLVLEYGGDSKLAAAGLLHDTLEDCPSASEKKIRKSFGAEVARLVRSCTDLLEGDTPDRKSHWKERKQQYVDHLRKSDYRTRLLVACDKLHNLSEIIGDLRNEGITTLERFNASPQALRWYYGEIRGAIGSDLPAPLLQRLDARLEELRERLLIAESRAPRESASP